MDGMMRQVGIAGIVLLVLASPAAARGAGGASSGHGNAGGAVRGLERAEQVASPQGQRGIENAERRIATKNKPRNPNVLRQKDSAKVAGKVSSRRSLR